MFLLTTLKNKSSSLSCEGQEKKDLELFFLNEYVTRDKAIQRRIQEQSIIGMIKDQDDCIELTTRGQNFLEISDFIKNLYSIK